ncbi:T9SS type A sorting domain-containing protein [Flavobacterium sp.]|uniref:T9SS type A sorting domain-containing protein n=1 Tax=Flavobacterium sp. TaxID=239 RepID=UPI00286D8DFC|nr:T9SS type A sorting domain-containing protein [Flavobacterium sp.]
MKKALFIFFVGVIFCCTTDVFAIHPKKTSNPTKGKLKKAMVLAGIESDRNAKFTDATWPTRLPQATINTMQPNWRKGFLDVTKAPYNAGNGGDDTVALQNAINDGYKADLVVFFPGDKTYRVSNQLYCLTSNNRKSTHKLIGSTVGTTKPKIVLTNGSTVADNILVFYDNIFNGSIDPSTHYGSVFRGIDIEMGNNPTVNALSMNGAQYCVIEDVAITGTDFNSGVYNLPGSGGGVNNLSVKGGDYGIYQADFRPNPTVFGLTLENQQKAGINVTSTRGPLIIAGFKITSPTAPTSNYRAIAIKKESNIPASDPSVFGVAYRGYANLSLSDGSIEVKGVSGIAIDNYAQDVTIRNTYFKSQTIIKSGYFASSSGASIVPGTTSMWTKLSNYVYTTSLDQSTVFKNTTHLNNRTANYELNGTISTSAALPATNFTTLHTWTSLPTWEDDIIDITAPGYGATPEDVNATDDDGIAIQRAIDHATTVGHPNHGKIVFIPRGFFEIRNTLHLKSGLVMIGSANSNSFIMPDRQWLNSNGPLMDSPNVATGSLYLADFGLLMYPHTQALHIQTPNTVILDVLTEPMKNSVWLTSIPLNPAETPYFLFSGNAGGKIYNLVTDQISGRVDENLELNHANRYHFVLIENTTNPITFYQISIEHLDNSPQMKLNNADNITVFGFKYEYKFELINITNCNTVNLIGGSGNHNIISPNDQAIIVISNSENVLIQNFDRKQYETSSINTKWIKDNTNTISGDFGILQYEYSSTLGTSEFESVVKNTIKIYPNPTEDQVTIEIDEAYIQEGYQIKITNILGQTVYKTEIKNQKTVIDSGNWATSGIYFMTVTNIKDQNITTRKIIKK